MYIEHKTDQNDRGNAWIGKVEFSRSGKTVYFNGQAFKNTSGYAYAYSDSSNYYDLETKDGYWISGVKKNGQDRHWAGGGKIMVDRSIVQEYLKLVDFDVIDDSHFELVDVVPTDKQRFKEIENESHSDEVFSPELRFKNPNELTDNELAYVIQDLREGEESSAFNKARRSFKRSRLELEEELEKRKNALQHDSK